MPVKPNIKNNTVYLKGFGTEIPSEVVAFKNYHKA
jgi:hypothetical protein